MKLQTNLNLRTQNHNTIDYNSKVVLLGSCFSEHMTQKLNYFKFVNYSNPFGILFQPSAIEKIILNAINEFQYTEQHIFFHNEQWHCFDAHSTISYQSKDTILSQLNSNLKQIRESLKEASHVIITLGSSWVYRFIETDQFVANCHKIPQKKFLKTLLSVDDVSEILQSIIALVRAINSEVSFIFTVSPVRHLKDGFVENTQSKSHLISAIHQVVDPRKKNYYFPSYEIMLDELRDYRFYKADMIHPNDVAVDYIWQKFQQVWMNDATQSIMKDVDVIQKGLQHKPFHPKSEAHQDFLVQLEHKKKQLTSKVSTIKF